ncbi:MAG: EFR1 family ferrodoxin [Paludibacteraceae bacterium]|nr:EFR1 family ferrodoxin [Paludibacteraceae bacterium]
MIFYYTSTGNSQWVAEKLEHLLEESIYSINTIAKDGYSSTDFELTEGERIIFVFPVHSWNVPAVVRKFISKLSVEGTPSAVYAVCTCGDDCGKTNENLSTMLDLIGLKLNACFSVQMPNNYVLMPGFNIDDPSVQHKKMIEAVTTVEQIADKILSGNCDAKGFYTSGTFPWTKSVLLYQYFKRIQCGRTPFKATDACVGCGLCAQVCPENNIRMQSNGRPQWRNHCTQCAACFHHCPKNAVQYGSVTKGKGQYLNSHVKFDD